MAIINIPIENAHIIIPALKRAIASAQNKVMRKASTAGGKSVREVYKIKAKDIKPEITFSKANINNSVSAINVGTSRIKLLFFSAQETDKGIQVEIKKGNREIIRSAFIEKMPQGHVNVFARKGKSRLPIKSLTTLGIGKMFEVQGVDAIEKSINANWIRILDHELDFRLSKFGAN